jgi:hypothetical protein
LNWQKKHPQSNHPLMLCLVRLTAVLLIWAILLVQATL